jgi:hypothetical protein
MQKVPRHWVDDFLKLAASHALRVDVLNRANGWVETAAIAGEQYFTKSVTYSGAEYYVGVDPKKTLETNCAALICGGVQDQLADIFVIPWSPFINALRAGAPVDTYQCREYAQYKVHVRNKKNRWIMKAQSSRNLGLDVTGWQHSPDEAVELLGRPWDLE